MMCETAAEIIDGRTGVTNDRAIIVDRPACMHACRSSIVLGGENTMLI